MALRQFSGLNSLEELSLYSTLLNTMAESMRSQYGVLLALRQGYKEGCVPCEQEFARVHQQLQLLWHRLASGKYTLARRSLIQLLNAAVNLKELNSTVLALVQTTLSPEVQKEPCWEDLA
jgi:hypothetical protein